MIGQGDRNQAGLGGSCNDTLGVDLTVRGRGMQMEVDERLGQRRYSVSGEVQDGWERRNNSVNCRSLNSRRDTSR